MHMTDLRDEIGTFLHAHGIRLNTDLGQHFLIDREILDQIMDAAAIEDTDDVIEIGPGIGVLTRELLHDAGHVTAVELDKRMIPLLTEFAANEPELRAKLRVVEGNALLFPLPNQPYKIVANIPYHITSPLLRHAFIESPVRPTTMTILIQREVAEKICDTENAGILTILVSLFGTPSIVCRVPPSSFLPPPAVQSAVLHIKSHPEPLADVETVEKIFKLTKIGFGQKRKMIRNSIGKLEGGMELLQKTGIDPERRPETLQVEEWIELARRSILT